MIGMTKVMAPELTGHGITVNCIAPGSSIPRPSADNRPHGEPAVPHDGGLLAY